MEVRIYDVDGNEYIDYICSWGPLMLGHSPKEISEGIEEVIIKGNKLWSTNCNRS